jgi:hypothetical protein
VDLREGLLVNTDGRNRPLRASGARGSRDSGRDPSGGRVQICHGTLPSNPHRTALHHDGDPSSARRHMVAASNIRRATCNDVLPDTSTRRSRQTQVRDAAVALEPPEEPAVRRF